MRLCGGNANLQRPKSSCHHLPTLTLPNSHWMLIETGEGMTRFRKWDADDFISIIPAASPVLYLHSALPHQLWCLSTRWIIIVQVWSPASHWKCNEDCGQNDFMERQKQSARKQRLWNNVLLYLVRVFLLHVPQWWTLCYLLQNRNSTGTQPLREHNLNLHAPWAV